MPLLLPGIASRVPTEPSRSRASTLESPRCNSVRQGREDRPSLVHFRERVSVVDITPVKSTSPALHSKPWVNVKREDFTAIRLLGSGGFGEVKLVRYDLDGELHAMKAIEKVNVLERRHYGNKEPTKGAWSERDFGIAARRWQCPFIVEMQAAFQTTSKLYFIYEFCAGGELYDLLRAQPESRFCEEHARFYLAELTLALAHLHLNDVVHRDVKLENVLLTQDGHMKLADFGSVRAKFPKQGSRSFVESTSPIIFMPPEFRLGKTYGKELDCWQLGIVTFAMLTGGYPPVGSKCAPPRLQPETSKPATDFCHALLAEDRTQRLGYPTGAELAKGHAFFEGTDWISTLARFETPPFTFEVDSEDANGDYKCRRTLCDNGTEILRLRNFSWAAGADPQCSDTSESDSGYSEKEESPTSEDDGDRTTKACTGCTPSFAHQDSADLKDICNDEEDNDGDTATRAGRSRSGAILPDEGEERNEEADDDITPENQNPAAKARKRPPRVATKAEVKLKPPSDDEDESS